MKVYREIHDEFYLTTQVDLTMEGLTVSVWDAEDDREIGAETDTWEETIEGVICDVEERVEDNEITKIAGKQELRDLASYFEQLSVQLEDAAREL